MIIDPFIIIWFIHVNLICFSEHKIRFTHTYIIRNLRVMVCLSVCMCVCSRVCVCKSCKYAYIYMFVNRLVKRFCSYIYFTHTIFDIFANIYFVYILNTDYEYTISICSSFSLFVFTSFFFKIFVFGFFSTFMLIFINIHVSVVLIYIFHAFSFEISSKFLSSRSFSMQHIYKNWVPIHFTFFSFYLISIIVPTFKVYFMLKLHFILKWVNYHA